MTTKSVIFVGGTAYSGSTLLDMMLASGPQGFSAGEVSALFRPYRPHHLHPTCGCGDPACSLWPELKRFNEHGFWEEIFRRFPQVNTIVDSSKDPFWIRQQAEYLARHGLAVRHVLIWKTPGDFARSQLKRGQHKWERTWKNYHRLYVALVGVPLTVEYAQLVAEPSAILEQLCSELGVAHFAGKERYWDFTHHTLFGNTSAKIHLYDKESAAYRASASELRETTRTGGEPVSIERHRSIYEDAAGETALSPSLVAQIDADQELTAIASLLEAASTRAPRSEATIERLLAPVRPGSAQQWALRLRSSVRRRFGLARSLCVSKLRSVGGRGESG